ncbi:FecR domain-containing protein [Mucilaginibacter sp. UR6-1]|uniref:FecR family protein n=1 Tax=Mucilaginibacter sp. UR6-1 TaxID=1435643 RepID=UPI001E5985ED|nr:FecR domain-containing protein [Mucilaginibacter sp. UR6-1]MCC8411219.1 FecR domain-containing protein [Mucilaginibacter sp. UR6-1]
MNDRQRKSELFEKYMNNSCTREEFDEFLRTIKDSDNFDDLDGAFKKQWEQAKHSQPVHAVNWDSIYQNIVMRLWAIKKARLRFKYITLLLIICGAALFLYPRYSKPTAVNYITRQTAAAKTKVVLLDDGTRVTLNANSSLRYPENFNSDKREVYLTGEAYFEVFHDADKPFVIHSGKLLTHVLGTTFTVSAYPGAASPLNVTVLTGKVAVKHEQANALAVLTRGQSATMNAGKSKFELTKLKNPEDAIAWIDDKLIFENADLKQVAAVLSNKYGVTINVLDDKVATQRITAIFQGQTLSGILKAVTKITHTRYTNTNNTYTITANSNNQLN